MLVLSRHRGESVLIIDEDGRQVEVMVIRTGRQVRLGIKARKGVKVVRAELTRRERVGNLVDVEA